MHPGALNVAVSILRDTPSGCDFSSETLMLLLGAPSSAISTDIDHFVPS
jgi:hypothetical protein